jgi:hypothetical protein
MATYFSPFIAANACCALATPGNVLLELVSCDQPPIFSGSPYLNLTKSPSIHCDSAPDRDWETTY